MMTAKERVRNNLQAMKFENRLHELLFEGRRGGLVGKYDPDGTLELECRLEDIGFNEKQIDLFKNSDDQVAVVNALLAKHNPLEKEDRQNGFELETPTLCDKLRYLKEFISYQPQEHNHERGRNTHRLPTHIRSLV